MEYLWSIYEIYMEHTWNVFQGLYNASHLFDKKAHTSGTATTVSSCGGGADFVTRPMTTNSWIDIEIFSVYKSSWLYNGVTTPIKNVSCFWWEWLHRYRVTLIQTLLQQRKTNNTLIGYLWKYIWGRFECLLKVSEEVVFVGFGPVSLLVARSQLVSNFV